MALEFIRNDITSMHADAIVNAANETLLGGGGVDGAIHRAAGPRLLEACRKLGGCKTGDAKITKGYNLPARYVIHTVGPVYEGGNHGEEALLSSCYRSALQIAAKHRLRSVAFPLISAGAYGYPEDEAIRVAVEAIRAFLSENEELHVYLVFFGRSALQRGEARFGEIEEYIDDHYALRHENRRSSAPSFSAGFGGFSDLSVFPEAVFSDHALPLQAKPQDFKSLLDESFQEMLLRKIDEKGLTDVDCYKRANLDRKLFSKIRSNPKYKPKKTTVLAFSVALSLSLSETEELLKKAGFALSDSFLTDVIVKYYITAGRYNIFEINEVLFAYDQQQLGLGA